MHPQQPQPETVHPGPGTYIRTAIVLFVVTLVEVGVYYVDALRPVLLPLLLILSATKFSLVALFYMHLRYDRPVFGGVLGACLLGAAALVISFVALMGTGLRVVPGE